MYIYIQHIHAYIISYRNGSLQLISENIKYARKMDLEKFNISVSRSLCVQMCLLYFIWYTISIIMYSTLLHGYILPYLLYVY